MFENMTLGSTYCTKCGREVFNNYCPNCNPHVSIKQLTREELRDQFNKIYDEYTCYRNDLFGAYLECARVNNLIKDGKQ